MSDDDKKSPKKQGTDKEEETENKRTAATKDGTSFQHNRKNVIGYGAAGISPMGTVPVKVPKEVSFTVTMEHTQTEDREVNLDRSDITLEYEDKGLTVLVRIEDDKSAKGIEGGHISRLTVTRGDIGEEEILVHFDDGEWDREPKSFLETQVAMDAKREHNGLEKEELENSADDNNNRNRDRGRDPDFDI